MTVEELANKRYGGEFVFMFGHLEGRTRFVFECFDPRPDHEGKNTYMVSYVFRSSFVSEDQTRKTMVKAGNNATKILVKTFRGKLFKKAFERARRGKDISSFERQEKESGFNFLYNPNNGRMQSGHIIIDGIGLFKQIIHER